MTTKKKYSKGKPVPGVINDHTDCGASEVRRVRVNDAGKESTKGKNFQYRCGECGKMTMVVQ